MQIKLKRMQMYATLAGIAVKSTVCYFSTFSDNAGSLPLLGALLA